jgi:two-component system response regulator FlrC
MIDAGTFREDLYHRIAVFPIKLPPLRERRSDIIPLARTLLVRVGHDLKCPVPKLTPAAEQRLVAASWRGNVRELANALERAAILASGDPIDAGHLLLEDSGPLPPSNGAVRPLAELEKEAILAALAATGGNRRKAAELLGIGERTLYDKLKKYEAD